MLPWRRQAVIRKLLGCEHPRCIPSLSFSPLLPLDIFFFFVGFVYWQGLSSRPRPKFSVSSWRPGTSRKISECVIEILGHAIMIFRKFARFPSFNHLMKKEEWTIFPKRWLERKVLWIFSGACGGVSWTGIKQSQQQNFICKKSVHLRDIYTNKPEKKPYPITAPPSRHKHPTSKKGARKV